MPITIHVMHTLKADIALVYIMIQEYLEDILVQIDTNTYKIQEDCYTNDHLLL